MGFRQPFEAFILKTLKMEVFCVGSRAIMEMPGKAERSKVGLDLVCLVCPVIPLQAAQIQMQIQIRIQKKNCRKYKYKYKFRET